MKINFKEFKLFTSIACKDSKTVDVRESLANLMFRNVNGMDGHSLCHKIYESNEDIELSDSEIDILNKVIQQCTPLMIDSFNAIIKPK